MNTSLNRHLVAVLLPIVVSACAHRQGNTTAALPRAPVAPQTTSVEPSADSVPRESRESDNRGTDPEAAFPEREVVPAGQEAAPPESGRNTVAFLPADEEEIPEESPPAPGEGSSAIESPQQETGPLTLADLEQMALESNPSLMQLAAVVEKARGIRDQVGLAPNPVIGYFGAEMGDNGTAGIQGGFLSQTIVTGNKLKLNRDVAGWNIQELSWEYQAQRYRVLNDVRLRFYDVLGAQQRLKTAGELLQVAQEGVRIAERLRQAKQASRADVLQARVDLNQIRIIEQNARYEYEAAWKRLAAQLGRPQMPVRDVSGTLGGPGGPWEWESTYQNLLAESPQLQAARSRIQGALAAIRRQEVQPIPNLLTQVGVAHDNASGDEIANVQVGVPLPIFNRNQGTIRLALAEYQRACRDSERLQLQLRDELAVAFRNFQQAKYQVERYETEILDNARESLRLTEEVYEVGEVNFLRVLTARRSYFETSLRYVDALIALRQANVVLEGFVLTGGLTDVPDIGTRALNSLGQRDQALGGQ